jgi:hypothetical protein
MKKPKDMAGFGVIGLLLSVLIIGFLYYIMMKTYFNSSNKGPGGFEAVSNEGVNTGSYPEMVKSAKDRVEQYNQKVAQNGEQMKDMLNKINENSGRETEDK